MFGGRRTFARRSTPRCQVATILALPGHPDMSTDHWHRIRQLFDASLQLSADDRQMFLDDACHGDSRVRDEVASLLEAYGRSADFLENPVLHAAPGASGGLEGRRVGRRSRSTHRDRRHGRRLSCHRHDDSIARSRSRCSPTGSRWRLDRREQFAREAQAISALNHPHICLLHDVGHHEAIDYLVMEHVEGEPIDAYLPAACADHAAARWRCLPPSATRCTTRTRTSCVHRDLKPRNILVTPTRPAQAARLRHCQAAPDRRPRARRSPPSPRR